MEKSKPISRRDKLEKNLALLTTHTENKSLEFSKPFEQIIEITNQFLNFDPVLPADVANLLTKSYVLVFQAIRHFAQGNYFKEAYKYYQQHVNYLNDETSCAKISADLSFIFWMFNDLPKALKQGKRSLKLLEKSGNTTTLTGRYSNVGYIYECSGNLDEAAHYYHLGMQYGLHIQNEEVLTLAYTGLGRIAAMRGNLKQAIHFFLEAKKRIKDKESESYLSIANNLGIAYGSAGMYEKALTSLEPFINEEMKEKDPDSFITFCMNAANNYRGLNQLDMVEKVLQEALNCAMSLNFYNDLATILIHLGNLKIKQKEFEKALKWFNKAKNENAKTDEKRQNIVILQGLAIANMRLGNNDEALKFLEITAPLVANMKLQKEQARNHELLSKIYDKKGDIKNSYDHYKQYSQLEMKIKNEAYQKEIQSIKKLKKNVTANRFEAYTNASLISQSLQKLVKMPLIGCSASMQEVIHQALMVAENENMPVLIVGETGSGKEAIARVIHYASERKKNAFIAVNSAAFSTSLVESAFFGSEEGAFTGASKKKIGYFEATNSGTLFLDEIGDMPIKMQSKFLRVLEEKIIHRIGDTKDISVDFRIISATNKDLASMALQDKFRFDLLNRINVMEIHIPPLRKRPEDIPLLVDYYIKKVSSEQGKTAPIITKEALELLIAYPFPGNIRELKNIIQRSLLLAKDYLLDVDAISLTKNTCSTCQNQSQTFSLNLAETEANTIRKAMEISGNVQKKAAELLGITPYTLSRKLKRMKE